MLLRALLCPLLAVFISPLHAGKLHDEKKHKIIHYQPQQVHIAFGDNPLDIAVTWSTFSKTPNSVVEYGVGRTNLRAVGRAKLFVDEGKEKRAQYVHRVNLKVLKPFTRYVYHCGSDYGWSGEFWFSTVDNTTSWSPRLAIYGDLGTENARSLPRIQQETQDNSYDAIIHVGDMAYDMMDENGRVGDEFMRQLEPIAAYVPYMVSPGNHEEAYNFSHYRERFTMPGPYESLFYSFDLGPIHFISINTEAYYFLKYGMKLLVRQFNWLKQNLEKANESQVRAARPWIIVYGHRPMYCSNQVDECAVGNPQRTRTGLPGNHWFALEQLFYEQKVDVGLWGHEHSYERLWPVFNETVEKISPGAYVNPRAPVHITTGSAGCKELTTNFSTVAQPWSAFRSIHYGYTKLTAHNLTHLHFSQIAVDQEKDNDVIDDFWIVKDKRN